MKGFIIVDGVINLSIDGKTYQIAPHSPNYERVKQGLIEKISDEELIALLKVEEEVKQYTKGVVSLEGDKVLYNGKEVRLLVAKRILDYYKQGLPFEPLMRFVEKVMLNTSMHSQNELYSFLERNGLFITEDGDFLAHKGVGQDFLDLYSHTFDNSPGQIHEIPRNEVDDDYRKLCSYGFHVGTLSYATSYASGGKIMLVKVNPADVVSVSNDAGQDKLRTCRYEVIKELDVELKSPLYTAKAEEYPTNVGDSDDWIEDLDDDEELDSDIFEYEEEDTDVYEDAWEEDDWDDDLEDDEEYEEDYDNLPY